MIRVLAKTLGGNEVIATGRVVNRESAPFTSIEEAVSHLTRVGWTELRFEIDRVENDDGTIRTTWNNQDVTLHRYGSSDLTYLRGKPSGGAKISKSTINQQKKN